LRSYGLIECAAPGYPARTRENVVTSDGTLLVGDYSAGGTAFTLQIATEATKPVFFAPYERNCDSLNQDFLQAFREWLRNYAIRTINVAGNRESASPGIGDFTRRLLVSALTGFSH
jgi:hypothetical protein